MLICLCCWVSIYDYLELMIGWISVIPTKYLFQFTITSPYGKSCFVSNSDMRVWSSTMKPTMDSNGGGQPNASKFHILYFWLSLGFLRFMLLTGISDQK